jgi:heme-degrading monooxygenase HmoA
LTALLAGASGGESDGKGRPVARGRTRRHWIVGQTSNHYNIEGDLRMVILIVKFETTLSEAEVLATARNRVDEFRSLPGLLQKYYVKLGQPNRYGGIYVWDSMESLRAYRASDLAATIPEAYKVTGPPEVEVLDSLFQLR